MSELADQGGCLTADVKNIDDLSEAITKMVNEENLYKEL